MSDDQPREPASIEPTERRGLLSRHPRLGILMIGVLFLLPICAMVIIVFVLISSRVMNA